MLNIVVKTRYSCLFIIFIIYININGKFYALKKAKRYGGGKGEMRVDRQFECRNKCISEKGEGKGMKKGISLLLVITLILSAYAVFLPIASGQCENIALNKPTSQFGWVDNKENINDGHLSTFAYTYSYWGNAGVIIDLNDSYKLWNVKGQVYCSGSAARGYVDIYNR